MTDWDLELRCPRARLSPRRSLRTQPMPRVAAITCQSQHTPSVPTRLPKLVPATGQWQTLPAIATQLDIIHTYRTLFRAALRAVQYSKPARYTARDRLRNAFRSNSPASYDTQKIASTLEFLHGAATTRGLEHKIVKNLMHVWHVRDRLPRAHMYVLLVLGVKVRRRDGLIWCCCSLKDNLPFRNVAYEQFDLTVERLNESMGLCLR
jgi:hypothetical protein